MTRIILDTADPDSCYNNHTGTLQYSFSTVIGFAFIMTRIILDTADPDSCYNNYTGIFIPFGTMIVYVLIMARLMLDTADPVATIDYRLNMEFIWAPCVLGYNDLTTWLH
jgi:hypothetical protein